jgi:hypothetical protein
VVVIMGLWSSSRELGLTEYGNGTAGNPTTKGGPKAWVTIWVTSG